MYLYVTESDGVQVVEQTRKNALFKTLTLPLQLEDNTQTFIHLNICGERERGKREEE